MFKKAKRINPIRYLAAGSIAFISAGVFAADLGGGAWGSPNAGTTLVKSPSAAGQGQEQAAAVRAEEVLDKKLDASYTRVYLSELVGDLRARAKLETIYPLTLNRSFNFTLADKNADVKTILDKVVAAGNLEKEIKNGVVIFTQKADDKVIADLTTKLQDADRWKRCEAVWQLSQLADKRIYPLLFKASADADAGVVYWTVKGLLAHLRMLPYIDDAAKDNVVKALKKETDLFSNDETFVLDYFRMLGATSTPLSFDTLSGYLKNSDPLVRLNAVLGLEQCKDSRAAAAYQNALKETPISDRKKIVDSQSMGAFSSAPSYAKLDGRVNDPFLPQEMGNPRNPTIRDVMLEVIQDPNSTIDEKKYAAQTVPNYFNDAKSIGDGVAALQKADHEVKKAAALGINPWGGGMVAGAARWTDDRRCNNDTRWVDLTAPFLKDSDAKLRDQAIQLFGKMANPWTTRAIIQILKEGEQADKISALRGLDPSYGGGMGQAWVPAHRINDPLLVDAVTPFLTSANAREQKISAMVLTTYGETRAKDPLFNHLNEHLTNIEQAGPWGAMHEKVQTLKLMTQLHDTRAVDELTSLLKDKMGVMYRQQLVACLAALSDPHGNEALLDIARDKNADAAARTEVGLSLLNSTSDAQVKVGLDTLIDLLKNQQMFGAWQIMPALGKAKGGPEAVTAFLKDAGADAAKRVSAAELLSSWEMDAGTTDKFVSMLDDKSIDAGVRSAIGRALIGYKPFMFGSKPEKVDPRVVDFLIKAFKGTADGDDSRAKVAAALAWSHDTKALDTLNEALTGANEGLKKDAALGLASICDVRALDTMIGLLSSSDAKSLWQYNNLVNAYANDQTVAEADRAKAKKAVDAAAPKIKAAQEAQMAEAMKQFNNSQKPVKPPAPPAKSDF